MTRATKKNRIDRNSPIPIYKQIKEIIIEELKAADSEGHPAITEGELTRRFHVSRAPVRQALKELADEGYVYRERAKGTFPVQELPVHPPNLELGGLVRYFREQGMDCNSRILGLERIVPSDDLRELLRLNREDKVLRISRLIYLTNRPLAWTQTYLFVTEDFQPTVDELEEMQSVFLLLESELGISITRGDHQISASGANEEEAEVLDFNIGDPVLVIETKLYTRNNQLIGWRRAVNIPDDYKVSFTVNR
ncbi:GntR family transcriptional regulator [Paenibacillus thalictri]|uniref:GntR family transcriptional regulator n=1 Tax=Paenibacillus thalictri TaxID=2527873 RepID=A0A4Q9DNS7_9BACL|nr:GntR family transcriptional regulator [Paenibacillus thalictri]TBL76559.1 GntR family transcriptional regulator [Paenibacillus thalictri]